MFSGQEWQFISSSDELEKKIIDQLETELKVDSVSFAATWLEEGSKVIFGPNVVLMAIQQFKKSIPIEVLNAIGGGWNFFDGIAGNVSAYYQFRKLPDAKRRQKEKAMWAAYELSTANILNASTILTLLAQYGVLQGSVSAACSPLAGIVFAAMTWGAAIHSYVNLYRAIKKYNDPVYQFEDYLIKIENIEMKIVKLQNKLIRYYEYIDYDDDEKNLVKIQKMEHKIRHWRKEQEYMKQQAVMIAQFKFSNESKLPDKLKDKFFTVTKQLRHVDRNILEEEPPAWKRKLVEQLDKNQKEKVEKRAINSIAWTAAAVGMTLIAISPFAGPFAPAVIAAGVTIAAVAGAIKLGEVLITRTVNAIAKHQQKTKEKVNLLSEYKKILITSESMLSHLKSDEEKLRYRLSYEQNKQALFDNNPDEDEKELEQKWYEQLQKMDKKPRNKLLDMAEKNAIDDKILRKILDLDPIRNKKEFQAAKDSLSKNDVKQIINRECRMNLKTSIKRGFNSFFSRNKPESKEISVNTPGPKFNHN